MVIMENSKFILESVKQLYKAHIEHDTSKMKKISDNLRRFLINSTAKEYAMERSKNELEIIV